MSGTSAGSVVGAIVAAGLTGQELKDAALSLDYAKFLDEGPVESIPVLGPGLAVLRGTGIFRGDYAHQWIRGQLKDLGIRTFGDLPYPDDELPEERRYRLVVTATDVTTGQLVRLPWDYRSVYGLDPDDAPVADAVRASMSIPFFFRPVPLTSAAKVTSTLLDGGLLSNFPIDSLDRTDGEKPRHPTFGITVLPNLPAGNDQVVPHCRCVNWLRWYSNRRICSNASSPPSWSAVTRPTSTSRGSMPVRSAWTPPTSASSTSGSPRRNRSALREGLRSRAYRTGIDPRLVEVGLVTPDQDGGDDAFEEMWRFEYQRSQLTQRAVAPLGRFPQAGWAGGDSEGGVARLLPSVRSSESIGKLDSSPPSSSGRRHLRGAGQRDRTEEEGDRHGRADRVGHRLVVRIQAVDRPIVPGQPDELARRHSVAVTTSRYRRSSEGVVRIRQVTERLMPRSAAARGSTGS